MFAVRLAGAVCACALATAVASPALAAQHTTLQLDATLVSALTSNDVTIAPLAPGTLQATALTMPASRSGKKIAHKGGFKLTSSMGYVSITNIALNYRSGKAAAMIGSAYNDKQQQVKSLLVFKGGKNRIAKNGKWKNATVELAKSALVRGEPTDPAALLSSSLQVPVGTVSPGQMLGKATIIVKK